MKGLTKEEKKQRTNELIKEGVEALYEQLNRGESEGVKVFLAAAARFSKYSLGNAMLIFSQCPKASHIEGFRGWKKLGRHVRKGEKGIVIRVPLILGCRQRDDEPNNSKCYGFRCIHVFDISQTEGEPVPEPAVACGEASEQLTAIKGYALATGIDVQMVDELDALGKSCGGFILVRSGQGNAEEFATVAHEIAHEFLHRTEESRRLPKVVRETEAEAVASVVCNALGVQSVEASADYIHLSQGNAELLKASLERIQEASRRLIDGITSVKNLAQAASGNTNAAELIARRHIKGEWNELARNER